MASLSVYLLDPPGKDPCHANFFFSFGELLVWCKRKPQTPGHRDIYATSSARGNEQQTRVSFFLSRCQLKKLLYFEWSPPWHVGWRLSGEGCHWEYDGKNGEFENIDFRFPWLSDTSEMGFGHDVPFLNYSDRLPHPSDLCQPDRVRWG